MRNVFDELEEERKKRNRYQVNATSGKKTDVITGGLPTQDRGLSDSEKFEREVGEVNADSSPHNISRAEIAKDLGSIKSDEKEKGFKLNTDRDISKDVQNKGYESRADLLDHILKDDSDSANISDSLAKDKGGSLGGNFSDLWGDGKVDTSEEFKDEIASVSDSLSGPPDEWIQTLDNTEEEEEEFGPDDLADNSPIVDNINTAIEDDTFTSTNEEVAELLNDEEPYQGQIEDNINTAVEDGNFTSTNEEVADLLDQNPVWEEPIGPQFDTIYDDLIADSGGFFNDLLNNNSGPELTFGDSLDPELEAYFRDILNSPVDNQAEREQLARDAELALGQSIANARAQGGFGALGLTGAQAAIEGDIVNQAQLDLSRAQLENDRLNRDENVNRGLAAAGVLDRGTARDFERDIFNQNLDFKAGQNDRDRAINLADAIVDDLYLKLALQQLDPDLQINDAPGIADVLGPDVMEQLGLNSFSNSTNQNENQDTPVVDVVGDYLGQFGQLGRQQDLSLGNNMFMRDDGSVYLIKDNGEIEEVG